MRSPGQFRVLESIYLCISGLCLLDAKQLDSLIPAFPELSSCVLFMGRESPRVPVSLLSHRLRPEPLSRIFPRWLDSMFCIILFDLIPFPGRNKTLASLTAKAWICTSLTERSAVLERNPTSGRWHCSFGSHQELGAHLHWHQSGLLIPVVFSSSRRKHLRWAGALGSWPSAPYFLTRRSRVSCEITFSIWFF